MRRRLYLALAVALAAGAFLLLRADPPATAERPSTPPAPVAASGGDPPPQIAAAPLAGAQLRGRVVDAAGAGRTGAEVQALTGGRVAASARSGDGGAFVVAGLAPEEYVLVARSGELASEPLGPIPLAPGEELAEIELRLEAAGSIEGRVIDAATGEPLPGASVTASGASATSDAAGAFAILAIAPGVTVLRAAAPGYESREQTLEIDVRPVTGIEVPLSRGATLRGQVVTASGAPAPGSAVWVVPYRLAPGPPREGGARAAADGTFEIGSPPGQVQVAALSPDGETGRSDPLDVAPGAVREGLVVEVGPSSVVEGRVVTPAGAAVPGAEVRLLQDGAAAGVTATDLLGLFRVAGLAPGSISAVALKGSSRAAAGPVQVGPGETARLTLVLGEAAVAGIVVDDRGKPIPGAAVFAHPEGTPRTLAATGTAGPDGAFTLRGLPEQLLRVGAGAGGAEGELRGVAPGSHDLRVVVAGGQLVGVVLRGGRPATDFQLAVAPTEPGRAGARTARLLSPDGRFRMSLAPGTYEVRASAPGTTAATATAEVPARGSAEVRLELDEGGVIEGQVLDARTGAPIAGARVSTQPGGTSAIVQASGYPGLAATITGGDGAFRLAGVRPGVAAVFARHGAYRRARPVRVRVDGGAVARVDVRLVPGEGDGPERFGGVGMSLRAGKDGGILAAGVFPGSPSWEAGIRSGDRLLGVDGAPVAGLRLQDVVERVRGEVGSPIVLELQREDRTFRTVVVRTELRF